MSIDGNLVSLLSRVQKRLKEIDSPMVTEIEIIEAEEMLLAVPELKSTLTEEACRSYATMLTNASKKGETKALQIVLDWVQSELPKD
jgi:hypothetical protein